MNFTMTKKRSSAICRNLTLVLLTAILFVQQANSQTIIGRQKVDQFPTTWWGTTTYGLTWLPTDYSTNTMVSPAKY